VNNAVDAILEYSKDGDLWSARRPLKTLVVEFKESGTGVKDASRVFDPFLSTKPWGRAPD